MNKNNLNMEMIEYTWRELEESSKQMIEEYKTSGKLPHQNSVASDYMIVGKLLVYMPYIPLYQTTNFS